MVMERTIFNYLQEKGCCKYCSVRYLCDRTIDFNDVDGSIQKKKLLGNEVGDDSNIKRIKASPCIVCLDLLQDNVIDNIVDRVLISEVQKYDSKVFTCSISIPAAILIREHSLRLDVKSNFPEFYENDVEELALNRAWKFIIKHKLADKLKKEFENSDVCNFSINIVMDYEDNAKELNIIKELVLKKEKKVDFSSRKFITNILLYCPRKLFEAVAKIPPEIPTHAVFFKTIECKHNSVYIGGRYCKYSRELSQSPWIIDGVKTMETSVEEIIFGEVNTLLGIPTANLKFSSSGREDCDVRCLGKGRPFYIEILDPCTTHFTFEQFRILEDNINKSPLIAVRHLQTVQRADLARIKEGEERKTKDYLALCIAKSKITQEHIDKINNHGEVILQQKTPIRVLHRRPVAVRSKTIYQMKAELVPSEQNNLFELHVVTQAGTYVKEFVHGDFGRTKPNIGDIINTEVDIIALDVVAINLDWPEEIND